MAEDDTEIEIGNFYKEVESIDLLYPEDLPVAALSVAAVSLYPLTIAAYLLGAVININETDPDVGAARKWGVRCTYPIVGPAVIGLGAAWVALALPIAATFFLGSLMCLPAWATHEYHLNREPHKPSDPYFIIASRISLAGAWMSKKITDLLNGIFEELWSSNKAGIYPGADLGLFPTEPEDVLYSIPRSIAALILAPIALPLFVAGGAVSLAVIPFVWIGGAIKKLASNSADESENKMAQTDDHGSERDNDLGMEHEKSKDQVRQFKSTSGTSSSSDDMLQDRSHKNRKTSGKRRR